jgi:hypothetical protein
MRRCAGQQRLLQRLFVAAAAFLKRVTACACDAASAMHVNVCGRLSATPLLYCRDAFSVGVDLKVFLLSRRILCGTNPLKRK